MDFRYINDNGKMVSGTAGTVHTIYTLFSGLENYNNFIGTKYIEEFVKANSSRINENIVKTTKKIQFSTYQ